MIRQVPIQVLARLVGDSALLETQGTRFPCAVPVDGGVAVALPEPDVLHTWALTIFEPTLAAAAAARVLDQYGVPSVGATLRFGLPVVANPGDLLRFAAGLRLSGTPEPGGWTLADDHASSVLILSGPGPSLTVTWWDEYGGLEFAYPVVIAENRPSEIERALADQWGGLPLHEFTGNEHSR